MTCELTMITGMKESFYRVSSLDLLGNKGGFWINGYREGENYSTSTAGHLGSNVLFYDSREEVHRYEIKVSSDTRRMVNEINFLLELEEI